MTYLVIGTSSIKGVHILVLHLQIKGPVRIENQMEYKNFSLDGIVNF